MTSKTTHKFSPHVRGRAVLMVLHHEGIAKALGMPGAKLLEEVQNSATSN